jgi:5'-3' exoribonuclease 1
LFKAQREDIYLRILPGLKRLDDGSLVKDYEGQEKEVEQAAQMCVLEVSSEDSRFKERPAPPLSEEFPEGSKIFFLGEHAYGVAAQVSGTNDDTLSVVLAVTIVGVLPCFATYSLLSI